MNGFSKKFRNSLKINYEGQEKPLSALIESIFQIAEPIRNQVGSHWNKEGMNISDKEIMLFLEKTIELGKVLICQTCEGLPQKRKSDGWKCSCGKTNLHPLHR